MSSNIVRARRATESDARLLLDWRNDAATREASRSTDLVSWRDHQAWLRATLLRSDRILLVMEAPEPVGAVRWDRLDRESWELSITLAPNVRGRGLARLVLAAGEAALAAEAPRRLVAVVRERNGVAQGLFRSAGYTQEGEVEAGMLTLVKQFVLP